MARRGVIVFLVFGILIFSSVSFVSASSHTFGDYPGCSGNCNSGCESNAGWASAFGTAADGDRVYASCMRDCCNSGPDVGTESGGLTEEELRKETEAQQALDEAAVAAQKEADDAALAEYLADYKEDLARKRAEKEAKEAAALAKYNAEREADEAAALAEYERESARLKSISDAAWAKDREQYLAERAARAVEAKRQAELDWAEELKLRAVEHEAITGGIESLKGKVEVMRPDDSWKEVKLGTNIHLNDNIRTGKDGKVAIKLADDTVFTIGQNSQFTVGNSEIESILDFGRLKAKIKCFINVIDCYPVRFTNAVASVRGTEYVAVADQYSNTTTIFVNDGTVSVTETKTGSTQDVSGGNSGVVDNSGIKVNSISEAEWKNAALEFDLEKNQWAVYLGFLGVLLAIGLLAYKKMKNKKDSKAAKKQSVEHKKSEKSSRETKKWGMASLILAILSILFIILPYFGIILAVLAAVFAIIQKKHNSTKIATAGLVIGIIGIVLNIIVLIAMAIK